MDNLVYLDAIRENTKKIKNNVNYSDLTMKNDKNEINKIIKGLFYLENKSSLIDIINYIYNDKLSHYAEMKYLDAEYDANYKKKRFFIEDNSYDTRILAKDNNKMYIYGIQFKTKDNNNSSIRIFKYNLNINSGESINIFQEERNKISEQIDINLPESHEIILNSNIEVPDIYNLNINFNYSSLEYKIRVLKSWKYDFKELCEKNIILLYPLKVFDLRKRLLYIKNEMKELKEDNIKTLPQKTKLKNLIKDETYRFFDNMNIYIEQAKNKRKISYKDKVKFNLTSIELLNYFNKDENLFLDIKDDMCSYLKDTYI